MSALELGNIENELRKRLQYHYHWGQKQNNLWDGYTDFIYNTPIWEALVPKMETAFQKYGLDKKNLFNYAANRWFNFWSAMAVEQIFTEMDGVEKVAETKDSEKDFYLFGIPFDHKTSVFPKQFEKNFEYAQNHKAELIEWFYKNQSSQKKAAF